MFPWNFLTIVQIEILFTAGYLFIENKFCDCNWTRTQNPEPPASSKEFVDIQATIECGFTLKRVRDMTRTYNKIICLTVTIDITKYSEILKNEETTKKKKRRK